MPTSFGSNGSLSRSPLRLTLSTDFRHGRLDGAWWPRSRSLETELADLVEHFPAEHGRVIRAVYSRPDWLLAPPQVDANGGVIKVGSFPNGDTHMVILTLSTRNLTLLVVPPDTTADRAADLMRLASSPTNQVSAHDLLLAAATPSPRERAAPPARRTRSARAPVEPLDFQPDGHGYTARSESGREWRIAEERTGWRLEFRDPGDGIATNAGVHRTVAAAMAEARR